MTEAFAYIFLALDLVVGAVIIFAVITFLWWLGRRTIRPSRPSTEKPPG